MRQLPPHEKVSDYAGNKKFAKHVLTMFSVTKPVDIAWRMAVCGLGFGLFQSPNNRQMLSSAPRHRSGGASGMLGTARLSGQTLGAALVALIFGIAPQHGTTITLVVAAAFAAVAAMVSLMRISRSKTPAAA